MHSTENFPYSLWSRARLLAETDLGFIYRENGRRTGWLHPTEIGERLLPDACGVAPAMRAELFMGPDPTLQADVLAAGDREEALELELRGPDGKRIDTESIYIVDTHYLLSLGDRNTPDEYPEEPLTPEQQAEVDEMVHEWLEARAGDMNLSTSDEEVEFPRYQIQVHLVDDRDVP